MLVQNTFINTYHVCILHDIPHLFQKFFNALTKLERQVPIQGISLMNMAFGGNEFVWHIMIFFAKPNFAHKIIGSRYYFIGVI